MYKKMKLDLGSINVATFDTATDERKFRGAEFITRSTLNVCCVDTICATKAECSTSTCN
ncbi:MAG TPA: hypothetical protein VGC13_16630 [Longimicrobium sp.]|jgi:hypothetical protein|uniref:hypothetical protein n=1 Tax=Longimicrobium sp. TaxID=2029185 RepID=UPI002ED7F60D